MTSTPLDLDAAAREINYAFLTTADVPPLARTARALLAEVERARAEIATLSAAAVDGMADPLTLARWVMERDEAVARMSSLVADTVEQRDAYRAEVERLTRLLGPDATECGPITDRAGRDDLNDGGEPS